MNELIAALVPPQVLPSDIVINCLSKYITMNDLYSLLEINHDYYNYDNIGSWKILLARNYPEYYEILCNQLNYETIRKVLYLLDTQLDLLEKLINKELPKDEDKLRSHELNIYRYYGYARGRDGNEGKKMNDDADNPIYKLFTLACKNNCASLVKTMLDTYDFEILFCNCLPLNEACIRGHLDIVRLMYLHHQSSLLQSSVIPEDKERDENEETSLFNYSLYFAAKNGHSKLTQFLLKEYVSYEPKYKAGGFLKPPKIVGSGFSGRGFPREMSIQPLSKLLVLASSSGSIELVQWFLTKGGPALRARTNITPPRGIEFAYEDASNLELIHMLEPYIEKSRLNSTKYVSFCHACSKNRVELVGHFLSDPELCSYIEKREEEESDDEDGWSDTAKVKEYPINIACCKGNVEVVKLLLTSSIYQIWDDISEYFYRGMYGAINNGFINIVMCGLNHHSWSPKEIKVILTSYQMNCEKMKALLEHQQIQDYLGADNNNGFRVIKYLSVSSNKSKVLDLLIQSPHVKIVCAKEKVTKYWDNICSGNRGERINLVDLVVSGRIPYTEEILKKFVGGLISFPYSNVDYEPLLNKLFGLIIDKYPHFKFDQELVNKICRIENIKIVARLFDDFKIDSVDYGKGMMKVAYRRFDLDLLIYLLDLGVPPLPLGRIFHTFAYSGNDHINSPDRAEKLNRFVVAILESPHYESEDITLINNAVVSKDLGTCEILLKSGKLRGDDEIDPSKLQYYIESLNELDRPDLADLVRSYHDQSQ